MNRIQMRPYDPATGEVGRRALIYGYAVEKGGYVTLEEEELKNIRPTSTKTIGIEKFVDREEIDPVYIDGPYYLAPDMGGEQALAVIREPMWTHGTAALGRRLLRLTALPQRYGIYTIASRASRYHSVCWIW